MVTKKTPKAVTNPLNIGGIDIAEFKRQQEVIRQQANQIIADRLEQIQKLLNECTTVADASGVGFDFSMAGYGMGGWYKPNDGWQSSSSSC